MLPGWQVSSFLSSLYYLFKDAPARREDFVTISGSSLMPLKFVSHRWLENWNGLKESVYWKRSMKSERRRRELILRLSHSRTQPMNFVPK